MSGREERRDGEGRERHLAEPSNDDEQTIQHFRASLTTAFQTMLPPSNPLLEKLNEKHISTLLEHAGRKQDREFELHRANQRYLLLYFLLALVALGAAFIYLVPLDRALLDDIIKILVGLVGGFGAGYGFRSHRNGR